MFAVTEYLDEDGRSPFGRWFDRLDAQAAAKVRTALAKIENGNMSNVQSVGQGARRSIVFTPARAIACTSDGTTRS